MCRTRSLIALIDAIEAQSSSDGMEQMGLFFFLTDFKLTKAIEINFQMLSM